jgi:hypothetical protein
VMTRSSGTSAKVLTSLEDWPEMSTPASRMTRTAFGFNPWALNTRRVWLNLVAEQVPRPALGHLTAARIPGAKEQQFSLHRNAATFSA